MFKTLFLIALTLPLISACGIVRTAVGTTVDIVTIPVDLLTIDETNNIEVNDYAIIVEH